MYLITKLPFLNSKNTNMSSKDITKNIIIKHHVYQKDL